MKKTFYIIWIIIGILVLFGIFGWVGNQALLAVENQARSEQRYNSLTDKQKQCLKFPNSYGC